MCGIAGIITRSNIDIHQPLVNMVDSIRHRGPDDEGIKMFHHSWAVGLGHRRLSIIDLSAAGHQPMCNSDESIWIVFNGEIYNFLSVRKELEKKGHSFRSNSDTEVLIYAYQEWGIDFLSQLNGIFSLAIWDNNKRELLIARDRAGLKPLYYSFEDKTFLFSSEIKSIIRSGLYEKKPDFFALSNPTRFFNAPQTGFENIKKLPPAHYLIFKDGTLSINKYWSIEPGEKKMSDKEAIHQLDEKLNEAIKLQVVADVEVGSLLSGGLDSSIITVLMAKYVDKPISTFTIKFQEKDRKFEQMADDSYYAKKLADQFNFNHQELIIDPNVCDLLPKMVYHLDEPLADPAAINTYLISKAARERGIKVLLNGVGGDEIFGGYRKQLACLKAEAYQKAIPGPLRRMLESGMKNLPVATNSGGLKNLRWAKRFFSFASLPPLERYLAGDLSMDKSLYTELYATNIEYEKTHYYTSEKNVYDSTEYSYLTKMCLMDTNFMLAEHNLLYADKATMAIGVEGRSPLTDHNIMEFMFGLHPSLKIRGNVQKWLLKKVSEKYIPKEIIYRPKAPFGSPLRSWIRKDLKELIDDYLSDANIKNTGLYNPATVRKIINLDREGKEDYAHLIWQMLTVQMWFEVFFENKIR